MSVDFTFTKEVLEARLKELGREFRRQNGKNAHAEIVLIGGASIIINYGFRDMTTDADALIYTDAAMKDAINRVGDNNGLPNGWLNEDFKATKSFTDKLRGISVYYKTFSNILQIRTVAAEYLIAMKAMSGRRYKYDLSDIVGILWAHKEQRNAISREAVERAIAQLYGNELLPAASALLLDALFSDDVDYSRLYMETREKEREAKDLLLEVHEQQPGLINRDNLDMVIAEAIQKRDKEKNAL